MKIFTYSAFAKIFYRYANIPITLLLLLSLLTALAGIYTNWIYIFPALFDITVIYVINRYYIKSYKRFPYKIEANNEKMICADYLFSDKLIELDHTSITKITGGIFSGNLARPIYLHDENNNIVISFNNHLKNYDKLLTIVLSNITQELYNDLLTKAKDTRIIKRKSK
jgi:hypothetical protein